jgi:hypothetical protein
MALPAEPDDQKSLDPNPMSFSTGAISPAFFRTNGKELREKIWPQ